MKKILSKMRRAIQDYRMIETGDKVAVGVSGGKDSLLLYEALWQFKSWNIVPFDLVPIHINMGFKGTSQEEMAALKAHFEAKGNPLDVVDTDLAEILFEARGGKDACSLCSKMRRGALCNRAKELGCNKVALGHHADDVLETLLLCLIYEGRLSTFAPVSHLDRTDVWVIRPFIYLEEGDIRGACNRHGLPVVFNPCPNDKHTNRERMKQMIASLKAEIPFAKDNMLSAITHPERNNLWQKPVQNQTFDEE
ncbi:MAG: tRNA 2-thiocytidine(32) synthetase TtcA [Clostridia bacterium]|nr:tRNA 2-thiocytidine(32) synthetase TtcA [Clostridia bacterium]